MKKETLQQRNALYLYGSNENEPICVVKIVCDSIAIYQVEIFKVIYNNCL